MASGIDVSVCLPQGCYELLHPAVKHIAVCSSNACTMRGCFTALLFDMVSWLTDWLYSIYVSF